MNPLKKYWARQSERKQAGIRYGGICLLLILTLTVIVSVVSYLFTWKQDQSALSAAGEAVQNAAATSGLSIGHFLVTDSFGLAAFCVIAFLLGWCVKLLWPQSPIRLKKWFFGLLTLTLLLSWILSFVGMLTGWEFAFAGGLGGRAGAAIVGWLVSKLGEIVTGAILLALLATWLYCMSERFSQLLMGRNKEEITEPDPASEAPFETVDTFEQEDTPAQDEVPQPVFVTSAVEQAQAILDNTRPSKKQGRKPEPKEETELEEENGITVVTDDTLEQEVKEPLKPIDNRLDPPDGLPKYKTPSLDILGDYLHARHEVSQDELSRNNNKIRATLASYKIQVKDVTAIVGPTVTL